MQHVDTAHVDLCGYAARVAGVLHIHTSLRQLLQHGRASGLSSELVGRVA